MDKVILVDHGRHKMNNSTEKPILELRLALTARDFERMETFYRQGLGLEPSQSWPADQGRALVLDLGRAVFELFDEKQASTVDQIEVGERVSGPVRLALQVSDLEAAFRRLLAHGARLVHEPVTTPWGDRNVRVEDPEGMQVTLFETAKHP